MVVKSFTLLNYIIEKKRKLRDGNSDAFTGCFVTCLNSWLFLMIFLLSRDPEVRAAVLRLEEASQ